MTIEVSKHIYRRLLGIAPNHRMIRDETIASRESWESVIITDDEQGLYVAMGRGRQSGIAASIMKTLIFRR
jgi:hypothetical protein